MLTIAPGQKTGIVFSSFSNLEVCCVFSLESPHRGDSYEYIQHTIINIKKKIIQNYPKYRKVCSYVIFFVRDSTTISK